jgi:hypothetical protein
MAWTRCRDRSRIRLWLVHPPIGDAMVAEAFATSGPEIGFKRRHRESAQRRLFLVELAEAARGGIGCCEIFGPPGHSRRSQEWRRWPGQAILLPITSAALRSAAFWASSWRMRSLGLLHWRRRRIAVVVKRLLRWLARPRRLRYFASSLRVGPARMRRPTPRKAPLADRREAASGHSREKQRSVLWIHGEQMQTGGCCHGVATRWLSACAFAGPLCQSTACLSSVEERSSMASLWTSAV